jgi:hypothetical protein
VADGEPCVPVRPGSFAAGVRPRARSGCGAELDVFFALVSDPGLESAGVSGSALELIAGGPFRKTRTTARRAPRNLPSGQLCGTPGRPRHSARSDMGEAVVPAEERKQRSAHPDKDPRNWNIKRNIRAASRQDSEITQGWRVPPFLRRLPCSEDSARRPRAGHHDPPHIYAPAAGAFEIKRQTCALSSAAEAAAKANRAKAGSDLAPIFFMIEARWFSTVRWLRLRSAAMFLLG